jgi:hypothetical protein
VLGDGDQTAPKGGVVEGAVDRGDGTVHVVEVAKLQGQYGTPRRRRLEPTVQLSVTTSESWTVSPHGTADRGAVERGDTTDAGGASTPRAAAVDVEALLHGSVDVVVRLGYRLVSASRDPYESNDPTRDMSFHDSAPV